MSRALYLSTLIFYLLLSSIESLEDGNNDPSSRAGKIAIPLALHAKRIKEQRSIVTEPSAQSTVPASSDQMPATIANNYYEQHKVETLFPIVASTQTTQNPLVIWSRRAKRGCYKQSVSSIWSTLDSKVSLQSSATTTLNDLPLLHTTPTNPPSTLNEPLTTVIPILTTSTGPQLSTNFALRSAKHHRHGKTSKTPEDSTSPRSEPSSPDEASVPASSTIQTSSSYENRERCTVSQSKEFINSATTCKNDRSEKICALLFDDPDPKMGRRDPKCNVAGEI